jgi:hypothetical protein
LISLSRQPAVLADQPKELAVPDNLGHLRNQQGGRDSPLVRNIPIKVTSQGASSSGTSPQRAINSIKPMEGGDLKLVASKVGRLHLGKTKLSGSIRR